MLFNPMYGAFAFLAFMVLSQTIISLLSIFSFVRGQKIFRPGCIAYLIALGFLEFVCYRWIAAIAKLIGIRAYFKGVRT